MTLTQLSFEDALRERERGMRRALENSRNDYREALWLAVERLAASGDEFCADDVRAVAGPVPAGYSPNVVGAVISAAATRGLISFVRFTRSAARQGHGNRIAVWRQA